MEGREMDRGGDGSSNKSNILKQDRAVKIKNTFTFFFFVAIFNNHVLRKDFDN